MLIQKGFQLSLSSLSLKKIFKKAKPPCFPLSFQCFFWQKVLIYLQYPALQNIVCFMHYSFRCWTKFLKSTVLHQVRCL